MNLYYLQVRGGQTYLPSTRERINALIEKGEAEWSGSEYDEDLETVIHYADRRKS